MMRDGWCKLDAKQMQSGHDDFCMQLEEVRGPASFRVGEVCRFPRFLQTYALTVHDPLTIKSCLAILAGCEVLAFRSRRSASVPAA